MRHVWLGLVIAGAAACNSTSSTFEHRSELEFATRGVALGPLGEDSVVGMMDTTCQVSVADARIGADYDFPTATETVRDNSLLYGESTVIVISDQGAHVTYPERFWDGMSEDFGRPGVVDGRVYGEGVVLLGDDGEEGCELEWNTGADIASLSVAGMCAGAGMAIDRETGQVWLGDGSKVVTAQPGGSSDIDQAADLLAWDATAQVLYSAKAGSEILHGLEADGTLRWASDVGGGIVGFDSMGPLGKAAVMVAVEGGQGAIVTVDGFTGVIEGTMTTPEPALAVETSDNGKAMALTLPREVHFFEIVTSGY